MKQPKLGYQVVTGSIGRDRVDYYADIVGDDDFEDTEGLTTTIAAGRTKSRALRKASKVLTKMARDLKRESRRAALLEQDDE